MHLRQTVAHRLPHRLPVVTLMKSLCSRRLRLFSHLAVHQTDLCSLIFYSVNLMASLGTLAAIAKQRPAFMSLVVEAFESLHGKVKWQWNEMFC